MDASPPSFHLLEESDDNNNFITNPHKCRAAGISCDGQTFYDDPTCLPHPDEVHFSSFLFMLVSIQDYAIFLIFVNL